MKYFIFLFVLALSSNAYAADSVGFFGQIGQTIQDISDFFFVEIPALFDDITASIISWWLLMLVKGEIWSVQFSYRIAKTLIQDLSVTQYLSSAMSHIPANIGYYLNSLGIPDCIQLLIEAWTTRFVMSMRA